MILTPTEQLRQFDATLPLEQARTIPSSWYTDTEIASLERHQVFGETWQAVGRVDQVREPGRFLTADVAGEPVVVVRGEDGVLRAFANVCRHRAACVVPEAEGKTSRLRCRYHGWTYDLAGHLRGTPEFDGVADFRKEEQGLPPFAVAEWGPIVWVHQNPQATNLADFLTPLPERCRDAGLERMQFAGRREYRLECNWKVFVDNYLDGGYHINTVHPGLAGVLDYSQYRTELFGSCSLQSSPMTPSGDATLDQVRGGDRASYWWVFPNLMLNIYRGVMDTNLVLPLGPNACRVVFDFYFDDAQNPEKRLFIDQSLEVSHQIQLEDVGVCEEVQRGLGSRTYDTGRFSVKREGAVYHFHRLLAEYLRKRSPRQ